MLLKVFVVVLGIAGPALSALLVSRYWNEFRSPAEAWPLGTALGDRLADSVARTAGMIAGAVTAGVLVMGCGGRLMMRVLAATSGDTAQGRTTEAEATVGEVTLTGTIFLVVILGFIVGLIGLLAFTVLRRWLPNRSVLAGLVLAGIGGGVLARPSGLLGPDNPDFTILSPAALGVAFALGLIVLYGISLAVFVDRWSSRWPRPSRSMKGALSVVPVVGMLPGASAAVVIAAVILLSTVVPPDHPLRQSLASTETMGRVVVIAGGVVGAIWVAVTAVEVLTL